MIPNQWYVLLESAEVRHRPVAARRLGERLVFWRDGQGRVACQVDCCAHRGARLSAGELRGDGIQCPFHGLEYARDGRCRLVPANGRAAKVEARFRVRSYPTHEEAGFIWVYWSQAAQTEGSDAPPPPPRFFPDLGGPFFYTTVQDFWPTHYSRVIENQLDVAHLPFVHYNTIGRGNRTVVDGPVVKWLEENAFRVYVFNRRDVGTPARRPEELALTPEPEFHLEFRFPNIWQNHISRQVRVVAAFVPVDDENTVLYLRFYQSFLRLPGLGKLLTRLAMPYNLKIAHQDRRVVLTQEPKRTGLRIGEQLLQADLPIVAYRKRREELMAPGAR
jgi:phenylpropionate dioxygenase-like ring-hydroxylating dioxygenase large terminal subunit